MSIAWTIKKLAITITAKNQTITYGESIANGTSQVTVATLATTDELSAITLTPSGSAYTTNGYIRPSAATIINKSSKASMNGNYTISYVDGVLKINKASLTVTLTVRNQTVNYTGASAVVTNGYDKTAETFVNGDTISVVTISGTPTYKYVGKTVTYTESATAPVNAGKYSIKLSGLTATADNYDITLNVVDGELTINKIALTITALEQRVNYGTAIKTGTAGVAYVSCTGLVSADKLQSVTLTASTNNQPSGTITPSNAVIVSKANNADVRTGNYNITYVAGSLVIYMGSITINSVYQNAEAISMGMIKISVGDRMWNFMMTRGDTFVLRGFAFEHFEVETVSSINHQAKAYIGSNEVTDFNITEGNLDIKITVVITKVSPMKGGFYGSNVSQASQNNANFSEGMVYESYANNSEIVAEQNEVSYIENEANNNASEHSENSSNVQLKNLQSEAMVYESSEQVVSENLTLCIAKFKAKENNLKEKMLKNIINFDKNFKKNVRFLANIV